MLGRLTDWWWNFWNGPVESTPMSVVGDDGAMYYNTYVLDKPYPLKMMRWAFGDDWPTTDISQCAQRAVERTGLVIFSNERVIDGMHRIEAEWIRRGRPDGGEG